MNINKDVINDMLRFTRGESKKQYTFVALKPDSVNRMAIDVVVKILNKNGFKIAYHAPVQYTKENVREHYKEIYDAYCEDPNGKFKFYPELEEYLTRGPIYGLVIEGPNAVKRIKALCGDTKEPASGTMRCELFKKYGRPYNKNENGIHASGEIKEAKREISNFLYAVADSDANKLTENSNIRDVVRYIQVNGEFETQDDVETM